MNFKGANGPGGPELQALREYLSEDRFRPYLEASRGDAVKASSLYAWNTAASAALYGPLQVVEVTLRNAVHVRLTAHFGVDWFDRLDATLAVGCLDRISAANTDGPRVDLAGGRGVGATPQPARRCARSGSNPVYRVVKSATRRQTTAGVRRVGSSDRRAETARPRPPAP